MSIPAVVLVVEGNCTRVVFDNYNAVGKRTIKYTIQITTSISPNSFTFKRRSEERA